MTVNVGVSGVCLDQYVHRHLVTYVGCKSTAKMAVVLLLSCVLRVWHSQVKELKGRTWTGPSLLIKRDV